MSAPTWYSTLYSRIHWLALNGYASQCLMTCVNGSTVPSAIRWGHH